jgi:hypothetical protein
MRTIPMAFGVIFLAACASDPLPTSFSGPATADASAMTCVMGELEDLGYHTAGGSAGAGTSFVRMERENDEVFWLNMIGIEDSFDVLDARSEGPELRVVAYSELLRGDERQSAAPSDQARREARDVLDECTIDS